MWLRKPSLAGHYPNIFHRDISSAIGWMYLRGSMGVFWVDELWHASRMYHVLSSLHLLKCVCFILTTGEPVTFWEVGLVIQNNFPCVIYCIFREIKKSPHGRYTNAIIFYVSHTPAAWLWFVVIFRWMIENHHLTIKTVETSRVHVKSARTCSCNKQK